MKAVDQSFGLIVNGNKQFVIPAFQRNYRWQRPQCFQLWNDILRGDTEGDKGHFLGPFVTVLESGAAAFSRWMVIDGQQRLTTLTLLLTALRDHIRETSWVGEEPTPQQIDAYFLKNEHERDGRHYKLVLRRHDNETLQLLVDGKDPSEAPAQAELLVDAYRYFRELLTSSDVSLERIYQGIADLRIVDVTLQRGIDNPQLVFESVNSTGVDLTQSDLIRNYLLMGLAEAEQTRLYNEYWSKLEDDFRRAGSVPDSFLRDYIALRQQSSTQLRSDEIYGEFKAYRHSQDGESTEALLANMVKFGRYYASFLWPDRISSKPLADAIRQVQGEGIGSTHAMLVVKLYDCYQRELMEETDFIRALTLVKSYLVRRAVLRCQTRSYWVVFARIALSVIEESPLTSLQVALASQSFRFPSDEEFKQAMQDSELYSLRICSHLLEQLENVGREVKSSTENCSIEHIMPQGIDAAPKWKEMIGDGWEQVHKTWLHRLGNLTLVGYRANSFLSNRPFEEKRTMDGGFEQSPDSLNYDVRNQKTWTASQMEERGCRLADRSVEIWPHHGADEDLVRQAEARRLQAVAAQKTSTTLEMPDPVRDLLSAMEESIRGVGDVIEAIENKSVCCYDYSARFFVELLPMAYYLRVLIPIDFGDVYDPEGLAGDVSAWKFLPNVNHRECGVFIDVHERQQVSAAAAMIRQAFNVRED